ncbi:RNA 2'-phosphotransferase [Mycobacterium angelicum]|uniref:RNA 2'-phosphotransferase n=1 Tax=Mycobacterium angelicum TaxID=470074 RepID=A0A1X0A8H6_MYCAN|nr:RNA 2'-phosphotransferase [Mycobacterium angelicum]MCV7197425.1 RNA 2'-phosphotransferase [Mycobacterium angelicum]ORA26333.1 RNA 2'-phosphotransferase [Mycobacterium angelicum]
MADDLAVDLAALHVGSNHVLDGVGEAAVEFVRHEDGLADAASGWVGSSQRALAHLAARWEARHGQHKLAVGGLGLHVAEAMVEYRSNEGASCGVLGSVAG